MNQFPNQPDAPRPPAQQRIGIFAGTFDPIHQGHLAFAHRAIEVCRLDKVYFLVEPRPRHKQAVKSAEHRYHMVDLAIKHDPLLGSIHLPDSQFTIDGTLPRLLARFEGAQLALLMGDDVVRHLTAWPYVERLIDSVEFIIGLRHVSQPQAQQGLATLNAARGGRLHYSFIDMPQETRISSSRIRHELHDGLVPVGLMPEVLRYIQKHGLYA